jgi:predicted small lipoprotein YifL
MFCKPFPLRNLPALALLLAVAAGCGLKGAPRPPLSTLPAKTQDLDVRQQGSWILLEMGYPQTTAGGLTLGGIDAVELLGLVKPLLAEGELPAVDAREFEAAAETLLTLRGDELDAAVTGDRIQFRLPLAEELPAEPVANVFAVRTRKGDDESAVSNLAPLVPIEPPPAPQNLEVTARAEGVELRWELAAEAAELAEGFDVFRREAQLRAYGEAIQRLAGDAREFLDTTARYGQRYIYTVRTVAVVEPLISSAEAGEREIEYLDRFAPPLPRNVVALAERASVRLRWDRSTADDVAGYVIYRREPGRDFHRLSEALIPGVEYLDRGLVSGFSYSYRIQVVDREGNESPLSEPITTTAR